MNIQDTMQYLLTVARLNCVEVQFSYSAQYQFSIDYHLPTLDKLKKEIDKINRRYTESYKLIACIYFDHIVVTISNVKYNSVKITILE